MHDGVLEVEHSQGVGPHQRHGLLTSHTEIILEVLYSGSSIALVVWGILLAVRVVWWQT